MAKNRQSSSKNSELLEVDDYVKRGVYSYMLKRAEPEPVEVVEEKSQIL